MTDFCHVLKEKSDEELKVYAQEIITFHETGCWKGENFKNFAQFITTETGMLLCQAISYGERAVADEIMKRFMKC